MNPDESLRYPTGRFQRPSRALETSERRQMIDTIARAPSDFRGAIKGLSDAQLNTPYRPGGWTVRQVVHHVPDSHMNAFCRFKLGLTEDVPTIKPYDEARWAELPDGKSALIEESLTLLQSLHARWLVMLRAMTPADFARTITHPEWKGPMSLDAVLALYAWHGRHHAAHVTELRKRQAW
jgi:uncharacterized damage-inducible protein DinB